MMACATKKNTNSINSKRSEREESWTFADVWELMTTVLSGSIRNQIFSFLDEATKKLVWIGKLNKTFFLHFCKKLVSLMIFFKISQMLNWHQISTNRGKNEEKYCSICTCTRTITNERGRGAASCSFLKKFLPNFFLNSGVKCLSRNAAKMQSKVYFRPAHRLHFGSKGFLFVYIIFIFWLLLLSFPFPCLLAYSLVLFFASIYGFVFLFLFFSKNPSSLWKSIHEFGTQCPWSSRWWQIMLII